MSQAKLTLEQVEQIITDASYFDKGAGWYRVDREKALALINEEIAALPPAAPDELLREALTKHEFWSHFADDVRCKCGWRASFTSPTRTWDQWTDHLLQHVAALAVPRASRKLTADEIEALDVILSTDMRTIVEHIEWLLNGKPAAPHQPSAAGAPK